MDTFDFKEPKLFWVSLDHTNFPPDMVDQANREVEDTRQIFRAIERVKDAVKTTGITAPVPITPPSRNELSI